MPFKFPYTNFQELNLDWIIKKVKDLSKQIEDDSSIVSEYTDRLLAVETKADNAEATATAADARATGANTTANSSLTLATQAKQTAEIADLSTTLLGLKIGDLSSLYTTAKDTIVNAINEVWSIFYNATAVTNVTPAGTDPAVTYSNGVFTFDLPEGGDPDAVTHAELDAAIDDVEDRIDGLEDSIDDLSEALDNKADVIIDTASGDIASFSDGTATPLKALVVNVEPVQAGTGDPSPSNVRPISGRSGCDVVRTGKNLLNMDNPEGLWGGTYTVNEDGSITVITSAGGGASIQYILTGKLKQGTYTIKNFSVRNLYVQNAPSDYTHAVSPGNSYTFNYDGVSYLRIVFTNQTASTTETYKAQLELGSAATSYEKFTGNSYTFTWNEAGTVYGGALTINQNGSVDLIKRYEYIGMASLSWLKYSGQDFGELFYTDSLTGLINADDQTVVHTMCSDYKSFPNTYNGTISDPNSMPSGGLRVRFYDDRIYVRNDDYTSVSDFVNSLTNAQLVYELANPVTYHLTPQLITALKGYNNIWSDAGSVDVTYCADTKGYIDKLIAQVQALALGG